MLQKQFRLNLRDQEDFFSNCKKIHTQYCSFFYNNSEKFQTTVIVSKKVCLLATQRNQVKRKYLNSIQNLLSDLEKLKISLVIVVHKPGIDLSVAQITQHIKKNEQKTRI